MERRKIVAIVGNAACKMTNCSVEDKFKWDIAQRLGKVLVDNGYRVLTGGGRGVMRAAMAGAHTSENYREGDTIAIAPTFDANEVNDFADIVIPTGLNFYRDVIVAGSDVVIAVGGGAGTLNELTSAWKLGRMIIAFTNVDGWGAKIAGKPMDNAVRYAGFKDIVYGVEKPEQVIDLIKTHLPKYTRNLEKLALGYPVFVEKRKSNWVGPKVVTEVNELIDR